LWITLSSIVSSPGHGKESISVILEVPLTGSRWWIIMLSIYHYLPSCQILPLKNKPSKSVHQVVNTIIRRKARRVAKTVGFIGRRTPVVPFPKPRNRSKYNDKTTNFEQAPSVTDSHHYHPNS
jgi:hypothetical protein